MKYSLAINQRKIFLYDDIDSNSIMECLYYLHKIMEIDLIDREIDNKQKLPIEIHVNSDGGVCYDGLTLISLIETMKNDGYTIKTFNIGRAFSMALPIAICGTERYAYRYSDYMFHDVRFGCIGAIESMKEELEISTKLRARYVNIIQKYSNIETKDIADCLDRKKDWHIGAEEMQKMNGVDFII